jgi:hypothetical protein
MSSHSIVNAVRAFCDARCITPETLQKAIYEMEDQDNIQAFVSACERGDMPEVGRLTQTVRTRSGTNVFYFEEIMSILCEKGYNDAACVMIETDPELRQSYYALRIASEHGVIQAMDTMLHPDHKFIQRELRHALQDASKVGNVKSISTLLTRVPEIDTTQAVHLATVSGHSEVVPLLRGAA